MTAHTHTHKHTLFHVVVCEIEQTEKEFPEDEIEQIEQASYGVCLSDNILNSGPNIVPMHSHPMRENREPLQVDASKVW